MEEESTSWIRRAKYSDTMLPRSNSSRELSALFSILPDNDPRSKIKVSDSNLNSAESPLPMQSSNGPDQSKKPGLDSSLHLKSSRPELKNKNLISQLKPRGPTLDSSISSPDSGPKGKRHSGSKPKPKPNPKTTLASSDFSFYPDGDSGLIQKCSDHIIASADSLRTKTDEDSCKPSLSTNKNGRNSKVKRRSLSPLPTAIISDVFKEARSISKRFSTPPPSRRSPSSPPNGKESDKDVFGKHKSTFPLPLENSHLHQLPLTKSSEKLKAKKGTSWVKYFDNGGGRVTAVETIDEWMVDRSELYLGQRFACGAHSRLYHGFYKELPVAVKIIRQPDNDENREMAVRLEKHFIREVTLLSHLRHRNVIKIESHGLPLTQEALASVPPFSAITFNTEDKNELVNPKERKPEVAKTGLGSSAAMTTSVVAALLQYLGTINLPFSVNHLSEDKTIDSDRDLVHVIAQTAHCIAQGKIGSGFDVSAAVYGSQRYVRFSPNVLSSAQVTGEKQLQDVITKILKEKWDHETCQFSLPPLMTLLLGEPGTGGSSTPSMVGSIKQWQKSDPSNSQETWRRLAAANSKLESVLKTLNKFAEQQWEVYQHIVGICSHHSYGKWLEQAADQYQESIVQSLLGARNAFVDIRFHMQEMGKAANIPIEPESQARILDATMGMEGVVFAGVPGAGGFDAVFAVILGEAGGGVADAWSLLGVLPLLVREDPNGVALESGDPRTRGVSSGVSSIKIC